MYGGFGGKGFGLEDITTASAILISQNIDEQINDINSYYSVKDLEVSAALGKDPIHYNLEPVLPQNIEEGEGKDIVDEMFDITGEFPRINVIASQATDTGFGGDHMAIYSVALSVECWVKAEPSEGPQYAYKRAARIIEAVHSCMLKDPTLGGLVLNLDSSPQAAISPIFRKDLVTPGINLDTQLHGTQEEHFNGHYLCGGGIQYSIKKNSSL